MSCRELKNKMMEDRNIPLRRIFNSLLAGAKKRKRKNSSSSSSQIKKKTKTGIPKKIRKYIVAKETCGGTGNIYLLDLHERELHYALCALYNLKKIAFCMMKEPYKRVDKRWAVLLEEMKTKNIPHEIISLGSNERDTFEYVLILSAKDHHDYNIDLSLLTKEKIKEWILIQHKMRAYDDIYVQGAQDLESERDYHVQFGLLLEYPKRDILEFLGMYGMAKNVDFAAAQEKLEKLLKDDKKRKKILK